MPFARAMAPGRPPSVEVIAGPPSMRILKWPHERGAHNPPSALPGGLLRSPKDVKSPPPVRWTVQDYVTASRHDTCGASKTGEIGEIGETGAAMPTVLCFLTMCARTCFLKKTGAGQNHCKTHAFPSARTCLTDFSYFTDFRLALFSCQLTFFSFFHFSFFHFSFFHFSFFGLAGRQPINRKQVK